MSEETAGETDIVAELLCDNGDTIRDLAWRTASMMPGGRQNNMLILAICEDPWDEFMYGIYPSAKSQAAAIREAGESPISICSISIRNFFSYLKGWTVEIPRPASDLGEEMIWVLVLHQQNFAWAQAQATPPQDQLS